MSAPASLKCRIVRNHVEPCKTLNDAIEDGPCGRSAWKGLRFLRLTNLVTMKPSRTLVVIKSGALKKTGVILNFCPFCGNRIMKEQP